MRLLMGAILSGVAIVLAGLASAGVHVSQQSAVYIAFAGIAGSVAVLSSAAIIKKKQRTLRIVRY